MERTTNNKRGLGLLTAAALAFSQTFSPSYANAGLKEFTNPNTKKSCYIVTGDDRNRIKEDLGETIKYLCPNDDIIKSSTTFCSQDSVASSSCDGAYTLDTLGFEMGDITGLTENELEAGQTTPRQRPTIKRSQKDDSIPTPRARGDQKTTLQIIPSNKNPQKKAARDTHAAQPTSPLLGPEPIKGTTEPTAKSAATDYTPPATQMAAATAPSTTTPQTSGLDALIDVSSFFPFNATEAENKVRTLLGNPTTTTSIDCEGAYAAPSTDSSTPVTGRTLLSDKTGNIYQFDSTWLKQQADGSFEEASAGSKNILNNSWRDDTYTAIIPGENPSDYTLLSELPECNEEGKRVSTHAASLDTLVTDTKTHRPVHGADNTVHKQYFSSQANAAMTQGLTITETTYSNGITDAIVANVGNSYTVHAEQQEAVNPNRRRNAIIGGVTAGLAVIGAALATYFGTRDRGHETGEPNTTGDPNTGTGGIPLTR